MSVNQDVSKEMMTASASECGIDYELPTYCKGWLFIDHDTKTLRSHNSPHSKMNIQSLEKLIISLYLTMPISKQLKFQQYLFGGESSL
jgi:hypothetical protein